MSLNTILNVATSGMMAAQTGLRVVSDNIANINTAGYVRKTISQSNLVSNGMGVGVSVDAIKRATDKFMAAASLDGASSAGKTNAIATAMDNAQKLFGDPSAATNFFSTLDDVYSAFSAAVNDPSSTLLRSGATTKLEDFLAESTRITSSLSAQIKDTDNHISGDVDRVNALLTQIDGLNTDITRAKMAGADGTGSENIQSGLIDELSTYMDVQVSDRANGGVIVRSADGVSLAGNGAAVVNYMQQGPANGYLTVTTANSGGAVMPLNVSNGEIQGLLQLRNKELPNISDQLGEFVSRAAEELNRASNASSSVPAPALMTGKDTGLDAPTAFKNFTGKTTIAITNAAGAIVQRVDVDFGPGPGAGTMTVNGAAGPSFTNVNFTTQLTTALGGTATASFANGALSLNTTLSTNGIAIVDDATTPSTKAGMGFSQFFGLNDVVRSDGYSPYETGMVATDPSGFVPPQSITLRLTDADGGRIRDVKVDIPSGTGSMQETIDALNSRNNGVGLYGAFAMGSKGELTFTSNTASPVSLSVVADTTQRGASGPSLSQLFGVGMSERSTRGGQFKVDPAMDADPSKLPFAKLDLTVAAGVPALAVGDGRGALALAKAGDSVTTFASAGDAAGAQKSVLTYGADFSGSIARKSAAAISRKDAAESVQTEVNAQRQSQEGVNLDEELVNLTTFQQAFNASARLIQATKDMFDVLTNIV
jgi:flagellar hook-associated protein 1 FlgK